MTTRTNPREVTLDDMSGRRAELPSALERAIARGDFERASLLSGMRPVLPHVRLALADAELGG